MASQGKGEIAIFGICEASHRRKVAEAIWKRTDHALFLDPDLEQRDHELGLACNPIHIIQINGAQSAVLRSDACTNCGRYVRACPFGAIRKVEGRIQINSSLCTACAACVNACPRGGVGLDKPLLAWFQISTSPNGRLVHGRLADGVEANPEIVRRLLDRSRIEALLYGMETLVVDVPWTEGPLFDLLASSSAEQILVVDPSSTDAAEIAGRNFPSSRTAPTRIAVPTDDATGYRFLTNMFPSTTVSVPLDEDSSKGPLPGRKS